MKRKLFYKSLILSGVVLLFFACQRNSTPHKTKILGKIINPKKTEIVISKDPFNIVSDTLFVKSGNKFSGEINVMKEGLHYIFIFPEFQVIYLKPGDSLAFVLNTSEFDESLSFSGTSGFENNLLIDLFLTNEKENVEISRRMKKLNPEELTRKLDSFYAAKQQLINSYKTSYQKTTPHYKKIIDLYNRVSQYRIKENYLSIYKSNIPKEFKNHRTFLKQKTADANLPDLLYFAKTFIYNRMREEQIPHSKVFSKAIEIIDKEIGDPHLRDNMYMIYCKNYIIGNSIQNPKDSVFLQYINRLQNPLYKESCYKYIKKNNILAKGKEFPALPVRNRYGNIVSLNKLLKKHKNLISYWDMYFMSNFKSNLEKLQKIKEEYPELQIIVLNDNPDDFQEWQLQIPQNKDFIFLQVNLKEYEMENFLPYGLNQVFLLDSTQIQQSLINLYDRNFAGKINAFMKK